MGCGLLISIILTRLLSVNEYGEYRYFFSLFLVFAFFSLPASTNTIIRYVPQGYDWSFISLAKLRLKFSLLGSITFFILAINSYYSTGTSNSFVYIILAFFFPIYHCFDLFEYFLQSKEKFRNLTFFQVSRAFIRLGATVLVCWVTRNAIYSIITFICITSIFNLFSYFNVKKTFNIKMSSARGKKNEIYKMAITLSIFGLLPMISNHIDKIVIGNYINTESLAIYSIGMLIGETINGLFKGLLSVLNPKLVFYKIKLWQYCFVLLLGTFLGFIIASFLPMFIELLYTTDYLESIMYAKIVFFSLGIHLAVTLYHKQLLFHFKKSLKTIYLGQSIISVSKIALVFLFVMVPSESSTKLFLLAMMYPIKHILTGTIFFTSEKLFFKQN